MKLLFQPQRHRLTEAAETGWGKGQVGLNQPIKFQERLLVKHHKIELGRRKLGLFQAVFDGFGRKVIVVLFSRESLLLGCRKDLSIPDESGRRIMIEGRDPKYVHGFGRVQKK